ncbi:MAG: FAD-binding oxidoreductase [Nanoarchaeota archaeon]|nr:FAD-binding oxidoreductase [Nanoarchaeota archaeon]
MPVVWIADLKKKLKGDVVFDKETLEEYSHDASIFELKPKVVVFPKDVRDVEKLIEFVNENKKKFPAMSLTARAGGTDMTGGCLTESIVISFTKYFNHIKSIDGKTGIVEPGVYFRDFEKQTLKKGLIFPTYPASKSICALGGMIANNSGGEKSIHYGKTQDHVLSLKVVLADGKEYEFKRINKIELERKMRKRDFEGQIYWKMYKLIKNNYDFIQSQKPKVTKNSAGYYLWDVWDRRKGEFDFTKLFVGSQGTLGIITEAELELVKKKKHSRLIVCSFKTTKDLAEFVNIVLPFKPESLETFDDNTLKLSARFMPEIAQKTGRGVFSLLFSFWREALMVLRYGFPKFVVLVEIAEDREDVLERRIQELHEEFKRRRVPHIIMKDEKEGEKYWTMRRESFNLLRHKVKGKRATPFIDDFVVKPEDLPKFLPELDKILEEHEIKPTLTGHAGSGNFHIIPLMDLEKKEERDKIPIVSEKVYTLLQKYHGSITAEHNDGLIRTPYLDKMFDKKMIKLFEEVKKIFDPLNIFNPGKKVHGDIKYAMSHVKKSS